MASERARRLLFTCGYLLLLAALISYIVRMALYPAERWTGGAVWDGGAAVLAILLLRSFHPRQYRRDWTLERISIVAFISVGLAAVFAVWIAAQLAPTFIASRAGIRRPQYAVESQFGVRVAASDGTPLNLDLYHPRRAASAPTILIPLTLPYTPGNRMWAWNIGRLWAERGFHVVMQGVRGRWKSAGVYQPFQKEHLADEAATLQWIKRQNWFDGRLGIWGAGPGGYAAWAAADTAIVPAVLHVAMAGTDNYEMFYPAGVFSLQSALYWAVRTRGPKDVETTNYRLQRGYERLPMIDADLPSFVDSELFNQWVKHSRRDDYWIDADRGSAVAKLRAPATLVAGWYDPWLTAQLNDWERIQRQAPRQVAAGSRLIIGPWGHLADLTFLRGQRSPNLQRLLLASGFEIFDCYFNNSPEPIAAVRYYIMNADQWRNAPSWPPPGARETLLYLASGGRAHTASGDGRLVSSPLLAEQPPDIFDYNPRQPVPSAGGAVMGPYAGISRQNDIESRRDILVYTSEALERDLEIAGTVRAILHVATYAPTTDFTAKLVDVHPDGAAYNVTEGILRRRYFDVPKPEGWSPISEIAIELWPTAMVFMKGHRIRLEVSSSNHPRFARNTNTGGDPATETHTEAVRQAVWHGAATPSRLVLPVIAR